ncbi:GH1 family beta-glucosidase [Rugosimonospora acidiphila]|uniref:Beta-glucosidase n=1 Tax=Rugosimonospora acidiphila TaxID=556531 RepID=A0ABP9RPK2_9ACTN
MTTYNLAPEAVLLAQDAATFPADFLWGAATAAYQIEGAAAEDGRTASIWDTFSHTPGRVAGGDTGDVACDHYHRYRDDVDLMERMGLRSYRFSTSWSRVQPGGSGPLNQAGVDFYKRLLDELNGRGIEPWLTLYHWDLPQELEDAGGWPNRDTAYRFADYAAALHLALGDRVSHWTTMNEPWCSAFLGYGSGQHAPGRGEPALTIPAAHHLMLGHGLATRAIRQQSGPPASVGITLNLYAMSAASECPEDLDATRRIDGLAHRIFLDPLLLGRYPEDVIDDVRGLSDFRHVRDGDLDVISAPLDLLGINYYSRYVVAAPPAGTPMAGSGPSDWPGSENVRFVSRDVPLTGMKWEIDAPGLVEVLRRVHDEYPELPLYVTENGAAFDDVPDAEGRVDDLDRVGFLDGHLRACYQAISEGVPLRGYFAWSLLDNFEWAWGYEKRFGMVYVDYTTQRRVFKASGAWYAQVTRRNGLTAQ